MIRFALFITVLITEKTIDAQISLEYKPTRPFYHPKPGNQLSQIVPPGKPWPASQAGYPEFSQTTKEPISGSTASPPPPGLVDRFKGDETTVMSTTEKQDGAVPSLEYKPNLPSFHPKPGNNIGQIVGPGKPWPSSVAGYEEFSQTNKRPGSTTTTTVAPPPPALVDRFEESGTTAKVPAAISLEYVPNQPFYYNPGDYIANLQPTTPPPKLQDRFNNADEEHKKKLEFLQSLFIKTDEDESGENSNESVPGSEVYNVPSYFYYPATIPYLIPPYPYPYPYSFVFYKENF